MYYYINQYSMLEVIHTPQGICITWWWYTIATHIPQEICTAIRIIMYNQKEDIFRKEYVKLNGNEYIFRMEYVFTVIYGN
jgi:hypothetical protein